MKRIVGAVALCALILALVVACGGRRGTDVSREEYLRVHVRANSNGEADQSVKYLVRDAVVAYLTPVVAACPNKAGAMEEVERRLPALEAVARETLAANGFCYGAHASLKREVFPTRVYESLTLPAGAYDALILELGTGEGDNWWCVVYPPLCFGGGEGNVVYKSKIRELVEKFLG